MSVYNEGFYCLKSLFNTTLFEVLFIGGGGGVAKPPTKYNITLYYCNNRQLRGGGVRGGGCSCKTLISEPTRTNSVNRV